MQDPSTSQAPPSDDAECLGRYRLGRAVGQGATGRLHLAERIDGGGPVVLKLVPAASRHGRAQLRAEADALGRLDHPHVVRLVDHGVVADQAFVALEALRGDDLATHAERGPIPRSAAILWLFQVASALDHVHARGLVHRDVKPGNVMIDEPTGRRAVLVDFGLATTPATRAARSTMALVCGTPEYMAPEQALGLDRDVGPAADRYALAAMALELLTGERPYPPSSLGRLLNAIVEQPPRRPSQLGYGGVALDMVFAKAMARDPERRFESSREQMDAIVRALPSGRSSATRSRPGRAMARTVRAKAA